MFSIACLLFFLGFVIWMNTSKRISWSDRRPVMAFLAQYPQYSRYLSAFLIGSATALCTHMMGTGSGLFAAVVILMAMGCLCVLFFPFRYMGVRGIAVLFLICILLELLV